MNDFVSVVSTLMEAVERGENVALASIVRVRGSSPRHNGACMLIWPDGRMAGTIGGGTLEWRVVEHARAALVEREPRFSNYVFDTHGGPDSVGLCGGSVDVHIDVAVGEFAAVAQCHWKRWHAAKPWRWRLSCTRATWRRGVIRGACYLA
jgi:xanthine dehydrogenase accessory factor